MTLARSSAGHPDEVADTTTVGHMSGLVAGAWLLAPLRIAGVASRSIARSARLLVQGNQPLRFQSRDVPAPARSLSSAVHTILDEIVLSGFQAFRQPLSLDEILDVDAEADEALSVFEAKGWLDDPISYHQDPLTLESPRLSTRKAFFETFDTVSFDSGYEPHPEEPGRDRWLSYGENQRARALILSHDDQPRPWLVCVHGAEMARATLDVKFFRAEYMHRVMGLNVVLPVLPLHGPRRKGTDARFPTVDVLDNVHGLAQGVWDLRRVLSWVRTQEPTGLGLMGFSLGGYTTALVAGFESDLDCVIAGGPATDFPTLMQRSTPQTLREDPRFLTLMEKSSRLHHVVSPLSITPKTTRDRLFIFAGLADRLAHPIEQVVDLWDHWGKPEILWHGGGHLGHRWMAEVARFIDDAVHETLVSEDESVTIASMPSKDELREIVGQRYASVAQSVLDSSEAEDCCSEAEGCCSPNSLAPRGNPITSDLYSDQQADILPEDAIIASLGCGNPTALADLEEGQIVLDLGSGGGIDVLLSARRVGPSGKAYGLDMTDEMLELARKNQSEAGVENAEFLKGTIENVPLPDEAVDVVISNCVINLSADKSEVFREAFRVLRPGGRFAVSDIVIRGELDAKIRGSVEQWIGCVAGALEESDYRSGLEAAGFTDVEIEPTRVYSFEDARGFLAGSGIDEETARSADGKVVSAFIRATKHN